MEGPLAAVALTRAGTRLALRLAAAFPGTEAFAPARFAAELEGVTGFDEPVAALLARLWPEKRGFFLVLAAGIAVRALAPLLEDKTRDPAVVVLDAEGHFAVPLLSGHLGGANELARETGRWLGATPVITTATDGAGVPAIEVWARARGCRWEPRAGVVTVNGAWANGDPVGAYTDAEFAATLDDLAPHLALRTADRAAAARFSGTLFALSPRLHPGFTAALWLRPPCLHLGVGCRKNADPERVEQGVLGALADAGFSALSVVELASVDEKADEPALHRLAQTLGVRFRTFPAARLAPVAVPTPSTRVEQAVGTPSVSEAAALTASGGGSLVLPKVTGKIWTLAAALRPGS